MTQLDKTSGKGQIVFSIPVNMLFLKEDFHSLFDVYMVDIFGSEFFSLSDFLLDFSQGEEDGVTVDF